MTLSRNTAPGCDDTRNELRISTLEVLLFLIGGGVWFLLLMSYFVIGYPPVTAIVLCATVEIVYAISYTLRKDHFGWAAFTLILGLWVSNIVATRQFGLTFTPYLFSLIILVASVIIKRRAAILLALMTTRQMREAREHRQELMRLTKDLKQT